MLDRVLSSKRVLRWAFITAWNPHSRLIAHWRNAARQRALVRVLEVHGYTWLTALGDSDDLDWTPEPSLLVLGIRPADARRLGRRFGQNAVVVGRLGGKAQLLWCDARDSDRLVV